MSFEFFIAKRYLFSKKTRNVINIISGVSVFAVAVGAMALIVVLSAFNGVDSLVRSLYDSFDPDIKITVKEGKTFAIDELSLEEIKKVNGVKYCVKTLEETAYLKYRKNESLCTVKGVEEEFVQMTGLDSMLVEGQLTLKENGINYAVLGYGIANNLGVFIENAIEPIKVFSAKREGKYSPTNPQGAFSKKHIMPGGIFTINQDFDMKYMLVPFDFAKQLLEYENEVSAIEIGLEKGADEKQVKAQIAAIAGEKFKVKTRYEQNELIFKTNETEKWATYLILTFILVIATFNVIGSLTMLIIDKKADINILKSMGASKAAVKNIFLVEGMLISLLGGITGLLMGALLCWGQQVFGFVRLHNVIVDFYPVQMQPLDFLMILATVLTIGLAASWLPVRFVVSRHFR